MKGRLLLNTGLSAVQVVVNAVAMLVLYGWVYDLLGARVGSVWSVVLAWTSAASVASLGLSGGVAKFVAQYDARDDRRHAARLVETAALSVAGLLIVVLLLIRVPLDWLLGRIYADEPDLLVSAVELLPYALGSFWLASVGLVILSGIDGLQRVSVRNVLVMVGSLILLALTWRWMPGQGLIGLAKAQVVQNAFLVVGGWIGLRVLLPALHVLPAFWRWAHLREMLGYGVGAQAISLAQMLFEPTAKGFLAASNPASALFFDMAHKLVGQSRAVITTAHAALVPTLSNWNERAPERLRSTYLVSCRLMLLVVAIGLPALVGLAPYISTWWLGTHEPLFVVFLCLLAGGWMLNLLNNPAYFDNMGSGALRDNVVGHALTGVLNLVFGWIALQTIGDVGVAVAFVVALLAGNAYVLVRFERRSGIASADWIEGPTLALLGLNSAGAGMLLWAFYATASPTVWLVGVVGALALANALLLRGHALVQLAVQSVPSFSRTT
jgi:O-antigen/teichoic acid export membrane protein